jgi:hypothetical protein
VCVLLESKHQKSNVCASVNSLLPRKKEMSLDYQSLGVYNAEVISGVSCLGFTVDLRADLKL